MTTMTTTRPNEQRIVIPMTKEVGEELANKLKVIALTSGKSNMKNVILIALWDKYPELRGIIEREIGAPKAL